MVKRLRRPSSGTSTEPDCSPTEIYGTDGEAQAFGASKISNGQCSEATGSKDTNDEALKYDDGNDSNDREGKGGSDSNDKSSRNSNDKDSKDNNDTGSKDNEAVPDDVPACLPRFTIGLTCRRILDDALVRRTQ